LPKAPDQPEPPPLAPYEIDNVGILQAQQLDTSFLKRPPRIDDDHKSIVFRADKIQQGFQNLFRSFTIVMSTQVDIRSFEVSYQVAADELPQQKTAKLYVEVQQAE
jgi:hypothetical protein